METLQGRLREQIAQRREAGLYRSRSTIESPQGPQVKLAGATYLNFCSNDYLGLAAHPRVVERFQHAAQRYGVGSGASHLVCGHLVPHHELEEALAEFTGRDRALLFSSGYMANVGVLTALLRRGDYVFEDRLNHASLLDGGLASGATFARYAHGDCDDLRDRLVRTEGKGVQLVAVDGVFSMDGDEAPLAALAATCAAHNACLMVDDAHGFGVLGASGAGSLEKAGLSAEQAPILMATLGKALGTAGAFVAGSDELIEALIQTSRNYIYTTALPPALASATLESLVLLREEAWRREHLQALIKRFRVGAQQLDLPLMDSTSAIQPLLVCEADKAVELSRQLAKRYVLISAIRPPTVPRNTSRLRITLTAAHDEQQVDQLLSHLADCWRH